MKSKNLTISLSVLVILLLASFLFGGITGNALFDLSDPGHDYVKLSKATLLYNSLIQHTNYLNGVLSGVSEYDLDDEAFWENEISKLRDALEALRLLLFDLDGEGLLSPEEINRIYDTARNSVEDTIRAIQNRPR